MKKNLKIAIADEMRLAREHYDAKLWLDAFYHLERAHLLGQRWFITHWVTHWWMLKVALRQTNFREIAGQITRLFAVPLGYLSGWVPKGNTGGSNVSPIKPMAIPDEFQSLLMDYNIWRDVTRRVTLIAVLGGIIWGGMFVYSVWERAGETRNIVSKFDGVCAPIEGVQGSEDIVIHSKSRHVYAVGGDRRSFRDGGPGRAKIWSWGLDDDPIIPREITPDRPLDFKSFGMDLHQDEDGIVRLFIVNRPNTGHTIEIFRLETETLIHESTLTSPDLINPNDIVAISKDSAYVTLDKIAPAGSLAEIWEGVQQSPTGKVLFINPEGAQLAADGLMMANGIAFSLDHETLYVAETVGRRISVYGRDLASNNLNLQERIDIKTNPDNLSITPDERVIITAHPKLLTLAMGYQKSEDNISPSEVIIFDPITEELSPLFLDDGKKISGSSVALIDPSTKQLLIGSAFGPHVLKCTMTEGVAQ